jgi:hypothetical protein
MELDEAFASRAEIVQATLAQLQGLLVLALFILFKRTAISNRNVTFYDIHISFGIEEVEIVL